MLQTYQSKWKENKYKSSTWHLAYNFYIINTHTHTHLTGLYVGFTIVLLYVNVSTTILLLRLRKPTACGSKIYVCICHVGVCVWVRHLVCVCKGFSESLITRIKIVCALIKWKSSSNAPLCDIDSQWVREWVWVGHSFCVIQKERESGLNTFSLLSHALIVAELPLFFFICYCYMTYLPSVEYFFIHLERLKKWIILLTFIT